MPVRMTDILVDIVDIPSKYVFFPRNHYPSNTKYKKENKRNAKRLNTYPSKYSLIWDKTTKSYKKILTEDLLNNCNNMHQSYENLEHKIDYSKFEDAELVDEYLNEEKNKTCSSCSQIPRTRRYVVIKGTIYLVCDRFCAIKLKIKMGIKEVIDYDKAF
jgi:hypothetical protein